MRRIVRQWFIEDPLDAQYEDERASMETMVDPSANHVRLPRLFPSSVSLVSFLPLHFPNR